MTPAIALLQERIAALKGPYDVVGPEEITIFLEQNTDLVPTLVTAREHIDAVFGVGTPVRLTLDPDYHAVGQRELVATIQVPPDTGSSDRLALLEEFDRRWWLSQMRAVHGRLLFIGGSAA